MSDENVFAALGALFHQDDDEFESTTDGSGAGGTLSSVRASVNSAPVGFWPDLFCRVFSGAEPGHSAQAAWRIQALWSSQPVRARAVSLRTWACLHSALVLRVGRGATCYLNSLLQAMFMTPELRAGLYAIPPDDLGLEVQEAREAAAAAAEASKGSDAGTSAPAGKPKRDKAVRAIPLELQRLFVELQLADKAAVSTERLTTIGFEWSSNEERVQHDVSVRALDSCALFHLFTSAHGVQWWDGVCRGAARAGTEPHAVRSCGARFEGHARP